VTKRHNIINTPHPTPQTHRGVLARRASGSGGCSTATFPQRALASLASQPKGHVALTTRLYSARPRACAAHTTATNTWKRQHRCLRLRLLIQHAAAAPQRTSCSHLACDCASWTSTTTCARRWTVRQLPRRHTDTLPSVAQYCSGTLVVHV
jgi:hypothetical protein